LTGKIYGISDYRPVQFNQTRLTELSGRRLESLRTLGGGVLDTYGLSLRFATREFLVGQERNTKANLGIISKDLADPLALIGAISSVGVAFWGRGSGNKRLVDRAASNIQALGFQKLFEQFPNLLATVRASEGGRTKPGEKGGNPATFLGQMFGQRGILRAIEQTLKTRPDLITDIVKGDTQIYHILKDPSLFTEFVTEAWPVSIVVDNVDGTGKAARAGIANRGVGEHSSVVTYVVTGSSARAIPDEYIEKVVLMGVLDPSLNVDSGWQTLLNAFNDVSGISQRNMNLFSLDRARHADEIEKILKMGPSFIEDKDGDVMPAIGAALGVNIFENGQPLHGMMANIGGGAEGGLLLPISWLGGSALMAFASKVALKNNNWADRRNLSQKEEEVIRAFGFDPHKPFNVEDLYEKPFEDGVGIYGGITDNYWIPELTGVSMVNNGSDTVISSVLQILPNGIASILRFHFGYVNGEESTRDKMEPIISQIKRVASDEDEIKRIIHRISYDNRYDLLKLGFGAEYYPAITPIADHYYIDWEVLSHLSDPKNPDRIYDEKDVAIINAVTKEFPNMFVTGR